MAGDSSSINFFYFPLVISIYSSSIILFIISSFMFLMPSAGFACFYSFFSLVNLQLIIGSCANVYNTPNKLSLFYLKIFITISQVNLNSPWMLGTPIAFCSILVNLKGTLYGNFYLKTATSKQSPKSIWTIFPVSLWSMMFDGCLSPKPKMYPTIDIVAKLQV